MAVNSFLNAQVYSNVMLLLLKNQLVYGKLVDGSHKNEVTDENGLTVSVKRPPLFIANTGAALTQQRIIAGSVPITVNQYKNVHVQVSDLEFVQSFNELMQSETMKSAASTLAHVIDGFIGGLTLGFPYSVGTVGNTILSPAQFNLAHTQLMSQGVPNSDINSVVQFVDGEKIRGSLIGGNLQGVAQTALERVKIPILSEIDLYASNNVPTYTNGTHTMSAGPQVNGGTQNVNYSAVANTWVQNLIVKTAGNNKTVVVGERFTIANVNQWDNRSQPGKSTGILQGFTVMAAAASDGAGAVTLSISPPIIVQGTSDGVDTIANTAFATVDSIPADSAALTFDGAISTQYSVRAAFHKKAIALVSAKLHTPFTGESAFSTDPMTGISIRYWRGSDITTGNHIHRWDTIYGGALLDNRLGTRVYGS